MKLYPPDNDHVESTTSPCWSRYTTTRSTAANRRVSSTAKSALRTRYSTAMCPLTEENRRGPSVFSPQLTVQGETRATPARTARRPVLLTCAARAPPPLRGVAPGSRAGLSCHTGRSRQPLTTSSGLLPGGRPSASPASHSVFCSLLASRRLCPSVCNRKVGGLSPVPFLAHCRRDRDRELHPMSPRGRRTEGAIDPRLLSNPLATVDTPQEAGIPPGRVAASRP
jgi:hypothetical protein